MLHKDSAGHQWVQWSLWEIPKQTEENPGWQKSALLRVEKSTRLLYEAEEVTIKFARASNQDKP